MLVATLTLSTAPPPCLGKRVGSARPSRLSQMPWPWRDGSCGPRGLVPPRSPPRT